MMYFHPAEGVENFGNKVVASSLWEIQSHVDNYGLYEPHYIS